MIRVLIKLTPVLNGLYLLFYKDSTWKCARKTKAGNIFSPTTWRLPENPICDGKRKWVSFMIFVIIYKIELDISHPPRILLSWSWIWNWQHSLRSRYWYRKPAKSRWNQQLSSSSRWLWSLLPNTFDIKTYYSSHAQRRNLLSFVSIQ